MLVQAGKNCMIPGTGTIFLKFSLYFWVPSPRIRMDIFGIPDQDLHKIIRLYKRNYDENIFSYSRHVPVPTPYSSFHAWHSGYCRYLSLNMK